MKLGSLTGFLLCLVIQQQQMLELVATSDNNNDHDFIIPRIEINSGSPHPFEVTSDDGVKSGPLMVHGREGDIRIETDEGYTVCPHEIEVEDDEERRLRRGDKTNGRTRTRGNKRNATSFMFCEPCQNEQGEDDICPSVREVGRDRPGGITRGVRRPTERSTYIQHLHDNEGGTNYRIRARDRSDRNRGQDGENTERRRQRQRRIKTGTLKNLVILMKFKDHAESNRPLPSVDDLDVLFNSPEVHSTLCPTGSIRTIFKDNSNGQLDLVSTIVPWITLPYTEAYYANGNHGFDPLVFQAIHETLDEIENQGYVNFQDFDADGDGKIDAITILHSGYAAEWGGTDDDGAYMTSRIWSHKWSMWKTPYATWSSQSGVSVYDYNISPALWHIRGDDIGRIGVIAHELGHFLGLPDLYDGNGGQGLGSYSLMGNSWGFDGSQYYPPALDPWSKLELGWATAETLTHTQQVTLAPSYTTHQVIKITHGYPQGEYLLIENRQKIGSDYRLPQEGLVIYHVDEHADHYQEGHPGQDNWPSNGYHYSIAVVAADGRYDLENGVNRGDKGDVWYGSSMTLGVGGQHPNTDAYQGGTIHTSGNTIRDISDPSTIMTFTYDNGVVAPTTLAPIVTTPSPTQAPVPAPTTPAPVSSPPTQAPVPAPTTPAPVTSPPTQAPVPAPTTPAPTPSPTSPPTTSPPTTPSPTTEPPVVAYSRPMMVQVHTDNYPGETSWKVYDLCQDNELILQHGAYSQPNVDEMENVVLTSPSMYRIVFADTYGDGICCSYGKGSFQVLLGDDVVAQGGEFHDKSLSIDFGASSCDDVDGNTTTETGEDHVGCVKDSSWVYLDKRGRARGCLWASEKQRRWNRKGENGVTAKDACCLGQ